MRLPAFLKRISPIGETLEAMEAGAALLTEETAQRNRQLSVETADTGLSLWEGDYSLSGGGDLELRRGRIRAAMAGGRTLTAEELKILAVTVGGADGGAVEEDFSDWSVTLYALFDGRIPGDMTALKEAVARRQPAHLAVEVAPVTVLRGTLTRYTALTGKAHLIVHNRMEN